MTWTGSRVAGVHRGALRRVLVPVLVTRCLEAGVLRQREVVCVCVGRTVPGVACPGESSLHGLNFRDRRQLRGGSGVMCFACRRASGPPCGVVGGACIVERVCTDGVVADCVF
jgi:hypothetical protein